MNAKLKVAGLLGAGVLAIPGAGLIQSAVASDGTSSSTATEEVVQPGFAPVQEEQAPQERPDGERRAPGGRLCPEKDGEGGGSGSSSSESGAAAPAEL